MKIILFTLVSLAICGVASGLKCYSCVDQISNDQCTLANSTVDCNGTGQQCYANKNVITNKISKSCGNKDLCAAISVANFVGISLPYCCSTDLCNRNGATTLATSATLMVTSALAAFVASTRLVAF
ncbi:prostate stem cell antigen-like [Petromyzon marinus]|uniref:prostate stem cell antigen-like n=1 Tax=Petromyzon marinus TaxID=7757 RepID=UPI003F6EB158